MIKSLTSLFIAIYLFFAGLVYGDEPIKIDIDCSITPHVTEYSVDDYVNISITYKNIGRPFFETAYKEDIKGVKVYQEINGEEIIIYPVGDVAYTAAEGNWLFKNGDSFTSHVHFKIEENAPKGSYNIRVAYKGNVEVFEDAFIIK